MRAPDVMRLVAGFGVARALLFFSPIVLANLLSLDDYGQFELAQSWASMGALLLGFGLSASVPLILLRDDIEGRWDSLLLLVAAIVGGCLLFALGIAALLETLYALPVLVLLGVGALIGQGLWAATLKSVGRATSAVAVEAGFWTVAVGGALLIFLSDDCFPIGTISILLLAYAGALLIVTLVEFKRNRAGSISKTDLRRNFALGLPLMFTSVLAVIMGSSGRLILGQTSAGVEVVAVYAVLYRCTALPLVGHQILMIGLFRQIFSWPEEVLRARASVVVLGVTGLILAFWMLEPTLGFLLGQRFTELFKAYRLEGLTLLVQTILWSAIAINDLINSRLQIAGRVAKATAPVLMLGLSGLWLWGSSRTNLLGSEGQLYGFILGHFALMIVYYLAQCAASVRQGHLFLRLWLTVVVCTISAGGLILVGENI